MKLLGTTVGCKLASLATNIDPRRIETSRRAASVGAQAALGRREATRRLLRSTFGYLADRVAGRLRVAGQQGAPSPSGCALPTSARSAVRSRCRSPSPRR